MQQRGSQAYAQSVKLGGAPRETEARALIEAATRLSQGREKLPELDDLHAALIFNLRLWNLLIEGMFEPDNPLPEETKKHLHWLFMFVNKRTGEILNPKLPDPTAPQPQQSRQAPPAKPAPPPTRSWSQSVEQREEAKRAEQARQAKQAEEALKARRAARAAQIERAQQAEKARQAEEARLIEGLISINREIARGLSHTEVPAEAPEVLGTTVSP